MAEPATASTQDAPQQLPLFYRSLTPLSSQLHPDHRLKPAPNLEFTRQANAIPIIVDEFPLVQRFYPIVFGGGPASAPLALVGLANGQNLFLDEGGQWRSDVYVPAYVRRYPFLLAKLTPEASELSLCFDDSAGLLQTLEGEALFTDGQPSEVTKNALGFCEHFEQGIQRTRAFMKELENLDLLIDGEVTINRNDRSEPTVYRGFRMVAEEKVKELRGDQLRKLAQNGGLGLLFAHLLSLAQIRDLFIRQDRLNEAAAAA